MEFIENDEPDAIQRWIALEQARENAFCDDFDPSFCADARFTADAIADRFARPFAALIGHEDCGASGRDAARLQHDDLFSGEPDFFKKCGRDSRRFAGTGVGAEDDVAMACEGRAEAGEDGVYREK
jgi:hypothetical protein